MKNPPKNKIKLVQPKGCIRRKEKGPGCREKTANALLSIVYRHSFEPSLTFCSPKFTLFIIPLDKDKAWHYSDVAIFDYSQLPPPFVRSTTQLHNQPSLLPRELRSIPVPYSSRVKKLDNLWAIHEARLDSSEVTSGGSRVAYDLHLGSCSLLNDLG